MDPDSSLRFASAFFSFGLLNNTPYVLILSAALSILPADTPKGVLLFANIAPALAVKLFWPYFVRGNIQYARRVFACSLLSFGGMLCVALNEGLYPRLAGIAIASFSSGLGEMTFLQLATLYGEATNGTDKAISWFASGTGGAGLFGAGLWWTLRGLGVTKGLGLCSILPLFLAVTYLLLPSPSKMSASDAYAALPVSDVEEEGAEETPPEIETKEDHLTTSEKVRIARPLLVRYMLPLFFVYLAEYTINTGVAPTLIYPIPEPKAQPFLADIIKSLRDYYPLWQLVYQTFVFFSRSSISIFRLPPIPLSCLPLPTLFQILLLLITSLESARGTLESLFGSQNIIYIIFVCVAAEGIAGGLAYVNVFYRIGREEGDSSQSVKRRSTEKEFKIASVGFADTLGILVASLVSSALEPALCDAQVARGKALCKEI